MDYDYVCIKPFDEIAYRYNYVIGLEPMWHYTNVPITNVGFKASTPDHFMAKLTLKNYERYFSDPEYKASLWKDMDNHTFEDVWDSVRS